MRALGIYIITAASSAVATIAVGKLLMPSPSADVVDVQPIPVTAAIQEITRPPEPELEIDSAVPDAQWDSGTEDSEPSTIDALPSDERGPEGQEQSVAAVQPQASASTSRSAPADKKGARAPSAPRLAGGGRLQIFSQPSLPVRYEGTDIHDGTVRLGGRRGEVTVGQPGKPFLLHIKYHVRGKAVALDIRSDPWALVETRAGLGLGKTPIIIEPTRATALRFVHPPSGKEMFLTLRYHP